MKSKVLLALTSAVGLFCALLFFWMSNDPAARRSADNSHEGHAIFDVDRGSPRTEPAKSIDVPADFLASVIRKAAAPGQRERLRAKNKANLTVAEQQIVDRIIAALRPDLQKIEMRSAETLRKLRTPEGANIVVIRLPEPSAAQINEYHNRSSKALQSLPPDASRELQKVTRSEVEAELHSYVDFPKPYHVLSFSILKDSKGIFFQDKFADKISDILEREAYFTISSDDDARFQGNYFKDKRIAERYGYLFDIESIKNIEISN